MRGANGGLEVRMVHQVGLAAIVSGVAAQALKPFIDVLRKRGFNFLRMLDTGGMPSSHTAVVTTLTTGVAYYQGVSSPLFGVSLIMSLYFIFEATGLRQEVGHQARVLNDLVEHVRATGSRHVEPEVLRELIGHTWIEVFAGLGLGFIVALLMF
jgi:acid phosphatase family membrane protein YuiD